MSLASKNKNEEKRNHIKPWLTATRVAIPTHELIKICRRWDRATWDAYLSWYESPCRQKLIVPHIYEKICEEQTESIFEQFQQSSDEEKRDRCEALLGMLPTIEAEVLRLYFMDGRTEVEVGFLLNRSQTGVHLIKNRALSRLKRGNAGDGMFTRQYMRGEISSIAEEPRLWDTKFEHLLEVSPGLDPNNHRAEFESIKTQSLRVALLALSETAQRILYLRYWCNFSARKTARTLGLGINVVAYIEAATITKVKRNAAFFEAGLTSGGDACN